jgi:TonB family protein
LKIDRNHIVQYLNGELPHDQQHELEKMMLEDPFLSDAIEGLAEVKNPEKVNEILSEIEASIELSYGEVRKVVPLYRNPLAIAAVISLVVLSVAVVFLVPDYKEKLQSFVLTEKSTDQDQDQARSEKEETIIPEQEKQLESVEADPEIPEARTEAEESQEEEVVLDDQIAGEGMETESQLETAMLLDTAEQIEEPQTGVTEVLLTDNLEVEDSISIDTEETDIAGLTGEEVEEVTDMVLMAEEEVPEEMMIEDTDPAAKRAAPASTELRGAVAIENSVFGTVTSEDGQPVAGVNVFFQGTSRGFVTDFNGAYVLQMEEGNATLLFSFIGFQTHEIDVSPGGGQYDVVLKADLSQLSEVIVTGYSTGESRVSGNDQFTRPEIPRSNYNRYLRDNLVYPQQAIDNSISGRVVVEVTISPDGSISNLEIIQSLGFGCDEEAIRLIREGPGWVAAIKNGVAVEEKVQVSVRFRP